MAKGTKKDLNGKVKKVDLTQPRSNWIKSDDPALQEKRAKDLRKSRYQTAQNAVAHELRNKQDEEALEQKIRDEKFQALIDLSNKPAI